jgi:hypothetical protein
VTSQPFIGPILHDDRLGALADALNDVEKTWIATGNRYRQLINTEPDEDGVLRGFGMPFDHPIVVQVAALRDGLDTLLKAQTRALERRMKTHPLAPWVAGTLGIGWKQGARLLAATGDPYWNGLHGRPRTVSELWAYCGLHTVEGDDGARSAAKRRKGVRGNWSSQAKMRTYLIAESCVKQSKSPYRIVYDARRANTAFDHPDWTKGHSHNDALRIMGKEILQDLWLASRDLYVERGWILE